ncbi:diguanylate cyclase [Caballeronia calidae]|uniref:Diguanylate cyclase n=1 Tax=Caballeronia calidae TaxID=1777139 RepID=A0A158EIB8_9BURK|nr:winged helix-turn-helix domain-containing protein [Caballeronia calidae]SAL06661.1 diguanylate cyclase [Caballeronia calidae]
MDTMGTQQFILNERWLLDETADQLVDLSGETADIHLKPIVTRLFGLLVRSPSVVLSRRKLFDEGWRRHGFEVCDNSLSQAICALRTVLSVLGAGAPSIKTIPRIGYALLADVRVLQSLPHRRSAPIAIHVSATDAVGATSLCDRDAFLRALESEWRRAQRSGLPLSLLLISVREAATAPTAHAAAMSCVAGCIHRRIRRAGDVAVRYTNNTFAILLPGAAERGAATVGQSIGEAVQEAMPSAELTFHPCDQRAAYMSSQAWIDAAFSALYPRREDRGPDAFIVPAPVGAACQVAV